MAFTTINNGSLFMNPKIYTGNGSTLAVDTGIDLTNNGGLCIAKNRNASNKDWYWVDTVRGATKTIHSNGTGSEQTYSGGITGFNNNGFQVGSATQTNGNGNNLVGYNFKAGTSVTGSSNTDGDVTSTITANTTSGFSIVRWTGTAGNIEVGHGTGKIPKAILIKNLSNGSAQWVVYHVGTGNTKACYLNTTAAATSTAGFFNNTTPTSSVFTVGTDTAVNGSSNSMIAYVFSDIQGYSKMVTYIGNGNADGPFVYTGFRPSFILMKGSSFSGDAWTIYDDKRTGFNGATTPINPNDANPGDTSLNASLDILSNGFKIRDSWTQINTSGATFIYMAFAEAPLVGTNNIPANAR